MLNLPDPKDFIAEIGRNQARGEDVPQVPMKVLSKQDQIDVNILKWGMYLSMAGKSEGIRKIIDVKLAQMGEELRNWATEVQGVITTLDSSNPEEEIQKRFNQIEKIYRKYEEEKKRSTSPKSSPKPKVVTKKEQSIKQAIEALKPRFWEKHKYQEEKEIQHEWETFIKGMED
jgi:hypothetical protein